MNYKVGDLVWWGTRGEIARITYIQDLTIQLVTIVPGRGTICTSWVTADLDMLTPTTLSKLERVIYGVPDEP